jgi:Domain of unknown function (DUF4861)
MKLTYLLAILGVLFHFIGQAQMSSDAPIQVVFKRQPHNFLPDSPKKITGNYLNIDSLNVPTGMANNNWVKFEGPVWENRDIAYRFYADTRHRFDIFGKITPQLVMDTVSLDYHDVKNWGTDVLKVGESLGIGSPAFFTGDSALAFTQWRSKTVEITQRSSTQIQIKTVFEQLISPFGPIDLIQTIDFYPDSRWTQVHLSVERGWQPQLQFCTGVGKHGAASLLSGQSAGSRNLKPQQLSWIGTFGAQSIHGHQLGMAVAAPIRHQPQHRSDQLNELLVLQASPAVEYFFMAAWELDSAHLNTAKQFKKFVKKHLIYATQKIKLP